MSANNLFTPGKKATVSITSAVTTANVSLGNNPTATTCRVKNVDTTNIAFIEFGQTNAVTATVPSGATGGSMPIGPGETAGFSIPLGTVFAAAICTAGTPIVYFTPGDGN